MYDSTDHPISATSFSAPTTSKHFLTAKEAASQYFHGTVSYWKILDMAKQNLIPHVRLSGRVLFRPESLNLWISQLEMRPGVETYGEAHKRLST